ncbi:hypothetical protein ACFOGG_02725 [Brenneria rubrifaciens]|uniref:hypothetical protein n=1 Tax=Brenneria rubrifaciens TaxID=55213 RepID=UPI00361FE524
MKKTASVITYRRRSVCKQAEVQGTLKYFNSPEPRYFKMVMMVVPACIKSELRLIG